MPSLDRSAAAVARAFVDHINDHDVAGLVTLMTEDHRFIDATDQLVTGRDAMRDGWEGYFSSFPDYRVEVDHVVESDGVVAVFGHASGTSGGKGSDPKAATWRIPAAWKAVVRDGQVAEWQVYCDIEPMLRSMGKGRFGGR